MSDIDNPAPPAQTYIHNPAPSHERPTPIGDVTVSSKCCRESFCTHDTIELIDQGNVVRCRLCGDTLSAFWALQQVHRQFALANERLEVKREQVAASYRQRITFISAKKVEQQWRRRGTLPGCPHCGRGIMVDDDFKRVDKQGEIDRRVSDAAMKDQEKQWTGGTRP